MNKTVTLDLPHFNGDPSSLLDIVLHYLYDNSSVDEEVIDQEACVEWLEFGGARLTFVFDDNDDTDCIEEDFRNFSRSLA